MRWSEREHPCIVDQNIDMAISEFYRSSRHLARARRVSKVRRDEIGFTSCRANLGNGLVTAFHIPAYDQDMDTEPGQFFRCRPANSARAPGNKCCRGVGTHVLLPFQFCSWY